VVLKVSSFLALALLGSAAFAQDAGPSRGQQAAAPVVNAIREALAAEAALPPARTVRERLERLGALDQAGRMHIDEVPWAQLSPEENIEARRAITAAMDPVDESNMAELRKLLPAQGWFTNSEFGPRAVDAAFHILQHSDDTEIKERVLPHLHELALRGEVDGFDFAAMFDRLATSAGRPQRYGTQFRCVARKLEPHPLEDEARVESLRAEISLSPTFAEYQQAIRGRPC
jgi:hypothetical protein